MSLWLVRNSDDSLSLFDTPNLVKSEFGGFWFADHTDDYVECYGLSMKYSSMFPEVKWEDKEPTEVELIIKK